jgi:hypothetical protein
MQVTAVVDPAECLIVGADSLLAVNKVSDKRVKLLPQLTWDKSQAAEVLLSPAFAEELKLLMFGASPGAL